MESVAVERENQLFGEPVFGLYTDKVFRSEPNSILTRVCEKCQDCVPEELVVSYSASLGNVRGSYEKTGLEKLEFTIGEDQKCGGGLAESVPTR